MTLNSELPQPKRVPPQLYLSDPMGGPFPGQAAVYVAEIPPKQEFEVICDEKSPHAYEHLKNSSSKSNLSYRPAVVFNLDHNNPNQDFDMPSNHQSRPSNVEVIRNRLSGNPRHPNWDLFDSDENMPPAKVPNWQRNTPAYEATKQLNTEVKSRLVRESIGYHSDDASNGNRPSMGPIHRVFMDENIPYTYCVGGSLESLKQPKRPSNFTRIVPGVPVRHGGSFNDIYRVQVLILYIFFQYSSTVYTHLCVIVFRKIF